MPKKPSASDAQLVLQLYDLRREAEMRKARSWFAGSFWPSSADDIVKAATTPGQENAWYRQVAGYWEMAAALVLQGALNEQLFFDCDGEMWFTLSRVYPYLKEYREKAKAPEAFSRAEKLAMRTKPGRDRMQRMLKQNERLRERMAKSAKA